jgi:uncharacterized protein (DUF952 family)
MENIIYHITTQEEWQKALQQNFYEAASLHTEGFIHCSTATQVEGVRERYFAGKTKLVKLTIDTNKLQAKLQYDLSPSVNEIFPHIYGAINLDAVIHVVQL